MTVSNIENRAHDLKLINIINESILRNDKRSITIETNTFLIPGIYSSSRFSGLRNSYTDIILDVRTRKPINVSLENIEKEFQLKTDAKGLNLIYPGILIKFINEVKRRLDNNSDVTKFNGKIPKIAVQKLMTGITVLGGPVDYYFMDDSKLEYEFDKKEGVLFFKNGYFVTPDDLAEEKNFFLKIDSSTQVTLKNLNENRVDLIKHDISILQESDPDAIMINIV